MEDFSQTLPRTEEDYLRYRVEDQINWFDKKSGINKRRYFRLKVTEIALSLCVPFISGYIKTDDDPLKVIVGLLGVVVALIAGLITLVKYQENWIEYRTASESLKLEKYLFLAKTGPYKDAENPFALFVERFETAIATSTKKWVEYVSRTDDKSKGKGEGGIKPPAKEEKQP